MSRRELALYIHIPFCQSKCAYCDFASYPGQENAWEPYVDVLLEELREWKDRLLEYEVATIFLGGGTPSLLPAGMIERILEEVRSCVSLSPNAEISMEANPGTLTMDKLKAYRVAGFNRLSIGAQSFEDRLLKSLGRIHTSRQIYESVDMARAAGFENLNLDLMYALPGQEPADWRHTLDSAIMLKPDHLSAYSLIVEPGTPMAGRVARGEAILPNDDQTNGMQRLAVEKLAEAGYVRYEISNFAQLGYACRRLSGAGLRRSFHDGRLAIRQSCRIARLSVRRTPDRCTATLPNRRHGRDDDAVHSHLSGVGPERLVSTVWRRFFEWP